MPSIPTSLTGMLGFLIIVSFLLLEYQSPILINAPTSKLNIAYVDANSRIDDIQKIATTTSTDWLEAIKNFVNIVMSFIGLILNILALPVLFVAEFIVNITSLPVDISVPFATLIAVAFILAFAKFIWTKKAESGGG